jgi:hypothetical protein
MREIKVDKEKTVAILIENREKHFVAQKKAMDGWKKQVVERLRATQTKIRNDEDIDDIGIIFSDLAKPVNVLQEYDDAIEMFEMDTRDEITLTEEEFKQFIKDRWVWKANWSHSNSKYFGLSH